MRQRPATEAIEEDAPGGGTWEHPFQCPLYTPLHSTHHQAQSESDGRAEPHDRICVGRAQLCAYQERPARTRYWRGRPSWLSLWRLPLLLLLSVLVAGQEECRPFMWPAPLSSSLSSSSSSQCLLWSSDVVDFVCAVSGKERVNRLKSVFIFPRVNFLNMLQGGGSAGVRPGVGGADCIAGSTRRCVACVARVAVSMTRLAAAREAFSAVLRRFDCLPAVDSATATRPFSPNTTCDSCTMWYERWLSAQLLEMWQLPPCVDWCFSAQLACPHLATSKVVDYAGHPSFQCRDVAIPSLRASDGSGCACVHPCDIPGLVSAEEVVGDILPLRLCEARRKACANRNASRTSTATRPALAAPIVVLLWILHQASL